MIGGSAECAAALILFPAFFQQKGRNRRQEGALLVIDQLALFLKLRYGKLRVEADVCGMGITVCKGRGYACGIRFIVNTGAVKV